MRPSKQKSRTFRRLQVKVPGGDTVQHYVKRKNSKATCVCGAVLKGVPTLKPVEMKNMPKTMKRPERPYGGVLCSKCMRAKIVASYSA